MDKKSLAIAAVLVSVVLLQSTQAFADDRGRGRGQRHERGSREVVVVDRHRFNYHNGRFYRPGLFSFNIALAVPPFGAVVHFLPAGHRAVVVGGLTYYHYNNIYYRPCPGGYIVVPEPVVREPAGERVTINILNFDGSYTAVVLTRYNGGYLGPQGEFYPQHPSVGQLQILYGR